MENAQRWHDSSSDDAPAKKSGSRAVPADWFLDPADPEASYALAGSSLEDQATAFLEAYAEPDEQYADQPDTGVSGTVTALHPKLTRNDQATALADSAPEPTAGTSVWLGLPGFGDTADDGELAWQADALCAQTDPEAFFPEKGGSTRDAKKVCSACTVRQQCLDYALAHDERFGIWGGMSERERRRLRKKSS